jgi:hypothetical protein
VLVWSVSSSVNSASCGDWFILLSVRQLPDHLINAISVEEEAWSWPNSKASLARRIGAG